MTQPLRRSEWRQTDTGAWTCSLGERGTRVRLFQKRKDGMFYQGPDRVALGTRDRGEAERLGRQLYAALITGGGPGQYAAHELRMPQEGGRRVISGPVPLGELWRRFRSECGTFLDNKAHTRQDVEYRAPVLLAYFGTTRDVRTLTPRDVLNYGVARRAGGIRYAKGKKTERVGQRTVHADLVLLRAMLRWACGVPASDSDPAGPRWLERNPLDGLRVDREKNPVRPVASWERFLATREALRNLAAQATTDRERAKWLRLELALVLAEGTGRRRGAIVALSWEDIDFGAGTIRWRAEYDKKGVESVIPVPNALLEELAGFRKQLGALTGRVFPSVREPRHAMPADLLTQWLAAAERKANLPKLAGGLWHPYRRKWASERMHLPLKAVADAGGWKDVTTLLTCYQHADEAALLEVMSEPRKRAEKKRADLPKSLER
ncbi:MAG: tyrosine-type recombinase/integrase [Gemmatimonadaceae bacterium]|nr:tyrosine-type recombinase/integrase [Gemmatimonadaceae bacterium]